MESTENTNLKPSIWLLGVKNKFLPYITFLPQTTTSRISYYLFYLVSWFILVNKFSNKKHKIPLLIGFFTGLIIFLILDFINNSSLQLVIDKHLDALTYVNNTEIYVALDNKYYNFNERDSVLMDQKRFHDEVKKKSISAIPILQYINKQYAKIGDTDNTDPTSVTSGQNLKLLGASYMIISLITLGIISGDISHQLFKDIMPYTTMATLFSVPVLSFWFVDYNLDSTITQSVFKVKSLAMAISFSITGCLIFLFGQKN